MANGNGAEKSSEEHSDVCVTNYCTNSFETSMFSVSDCKLNVYLQEAKSLFNAADFEPLDPTQEVIFPPELMVNNTHTKTQRYRVAVQEIIKNRS